MKEKIQPNMSELAYIFFCVRARIALSVDDCVSNNAFRFCLISFLLRDLGSEAVGQAVGKVNEGKDRLSHFM